MGATMVLLEAAVHPLSAGGWLFTLGLLAASAVAIRWQIGVTDAQYLRDMIPHHSMALVTSRPRMRRTRDPVVRALAEGIMRTQISEIITMKNMLGK